MPRSLDVPLSSLQAGRAIASVLLVLYHNSCCVFDVPKYWPRNPTGRAFHFGAWASFDYFFVLSGFVLLYVHNKELGDQRRLRSYAWRRFTRIYPVYWGILIPLLAAYFVFPTLGEGFERNAKMIVSSISLIAFGPMRDQQRPETIMLGVWSLYHGVLFYLVFGLVILSKRIGFTALALWLAGSAFMLRYPNDASLVSFYFGPLHLLFGLGMGAAVLVRNRMIASPRIMIVLGGLLCTAIIAKELWLDVPPSVSQILLFWIGGVAVLVGLAALETGGQLRVPSALRFLGDASYSIFLIHYPVLIVLAKLTRVLAWREAVPLIVWYALFVCIAVGTGVLFYVSVERPLVRRLRSKHGYSA